MTRSDWISLSVSLVAASIAYFVGGPKAAWVCLIAGLAIALALRLRPKPEQPTQPTISNTLTASPHIEHHVHVGSSEQKTPAPIAEPPAPKVATISCLKGKEVLLHEDNVGVWFEASTSLERARRAVVLPFKNIPKGPGEQTPRANDVTASLVFKHGDDELQINHGVWLNRYEYFTTINPGETKYLLVALKDVPYVTFENPNSYNPFRGRFRSGTSIYHPKMITL